MTRPCAALLFAACCTAGWAQMTPEMRIVADHITANSLRGDVSFLASDLLEGRDTPSRGLDIAGEYIASQFRRLGLEPVGDDGYFQTVALRPEDKDSPKSRNVAAILRGSDPRLQDSYVILSAHYDHVGLAQSGEDRVFNGANDDASGTAAVLEVANALAALHPRPKRSVLFILFCGEEKGLRGSSYYAMHPLAPLSKTVAQLNLEQLGRTDAPQGPRLNSANVTGFDYSDMVPILVNAGKRVGIAVTKIAEASDKYFNLSDNGPLAAAGVPAHTLSVTYDFPDYHAVGDEWQKIDYDNMAKVDQAVGIATLRLAQAPTTPHWNDRDPAAKPFAEAAKKLHGQ
ncbi:MAG: M20/M25/M40 family metallo-hydrolase [Acidobacteriota bacterium]|nr:M20/M25/M40 family metallo-hydrolase [Acidobacteriota bacterium]